MSTAKFNTWLSPDGTENYKCRAWVNFNGTGTVAIRASGNVASITDNGNGDYTVNFTTAMPDANYGFSINAGIDTTGQAIGQYLDARTTAPSASLFRFQTYNTSFSLTDAAFVSASIFR